jgi:Tfp pilus assembly protein PilO
MTARDRLFLIVIATLGALAAVWFLAVAPEREKAATLNNQVSTASAALQSAEASLAAARSAEAKYPAAYAAVVGLGKAVPASAEVPSLLYQLAHIAQAKNVEFGSFTSASSASPASAAAPATFTSMPFTLAFSGTYSDLYGLLQELDDSAVRSLSGAITISGRLLTVQELKLTPGTSSSGSAGKVTGVISATAYVLPASQGLTAGATASAPSGASPSATTQSSATTPAVVRVTP